jgi:RimJ/RimL family protein N-acetyltransferase
VSPPIQDFQLRSGNFALSLEAKESGPSLLPRPGKVYRQPTFAETSEAQVKGKIFYEIHPQLWGQGLMSEAFTEVLRFAFEEVGCVVVEVCHSHLPEKMKTDK